MGYLVCRKCGGYYELQEGESPEDFEKCECGGVIEYFESLDTEPETQESEEYSESSEDSTQDNISLLAKAKDFLNSSSGKKIIPLILVVILVLLAAFLLSGYIFAAHYENNSISFDYPKDWNITQVNFVPLSYYLGTETSSTSDSDVYTSQPRNTSYSSTTTPTNSNGSANNTSGTTSNTPQTANPSSNTTTYMSGIDPNTMVGEIVFEGPGITEASIKVYVIPPLFAQQQLSNAPKKSLNGYIYYELIGTGETGHNTGIFLKDRMGYTIFVAGDKEKADDAFRMITNSFRIKPSSDSSTVSNLNP